MDRNRLRTYIGLHGKEIGLFAFALCLRWAAFLFLWQWFIIGHHLPQFGWQFPVTQDDSVSYYRLAQNLLQNHVYSESLVPPFLLESFRLPGYPFFIYFFEWLGLPIVGVVFLQILLSCGSVVLTYLLGKKFLSENVAFIGALLLCIDPTSVLFATTVMSDTLFVFTFLLGLYFFLRPPSLSWRGAAIAFIAGLAIGFSILTRVIAEYLPPFLILAYVVLYWSELRPLKKTFLHIGLFCIGIVLTLLPWSVRNYHLYKTFDLSSTPYINFVMINLPLFYSYTEHISFVQAALPYASTSPTYTSLANKGIYEKEIADGLRGHLASYISFYLIKTIPFFFTDGLRDINRMTSLIPIPPDTTNFSDLILSRNIQSIMRYLASPQPNLWLLLAGSIPWFVITFLWLFDVAYVCIKRSPHRWFVLIASCIILYFAILTGPLAEHRYRMPAAPFMLLLAVEGAVILFSLFRHTNWNIE